MEFNYLNPDLNKVVNVTKILEERHIAQAIFHIDKGLTDYLSAFTGESISELSDDGYLWIMIGEFPVSTNVKTAILGKYSVDEGSPPIKFARWNTLRSKFPNAGYPKVKGKNPVFIGFPLPKEEL